jgi:hypothetical protein
MMQHINTFQSYKDMNDILTISQMQSMLDNMIALSKKDTELQEYYNEFITRSIKYAAIRANWELYSLSEKSDNDRYRTSVHDSVILSLKFFVRIAQSYNYDVEWCRALQDDDKVNFKRRLVGDLACYVSFVTALNNR